MYYTYYFNYIINVFRFNYQVGYDTENDVTSIMHVIAEERYGTNGILGKFITVYPIPQTAEKFSECKYITSIIVTYYII